MNKKKSFYTVLEDKHRGDRTLIKDRLKVYLDCIEPLKTITPHPKVLDLGCGRGEWLELLSEQGFDVKGIDIDDDMISFCKQKGFNAQKSDVVSYLKSAPKDTYDLISGFHIAEHLEFRLLQELISLSLKALKKGGLLILETPNPENIVVSSNLFYMDPTHRHPIPPELLRLAVEHQGFYKVKILRLQEEKNILQKELTVSDILTGVSPDYSILAQKSAPKDILNLFQNCFDKEYGVNLYNLLEKYDEQTKIYKQDITNKLDTILQKFDIEIKQLIQEREVLKNETQISNAQLQSILNSNSWRITKPLRVLRKYLKELNIKFLLKKLLKRFLTLINSIINKFPKFKSFIKRILLKFPYLYNKLQKIKNLSDTTTPLTHNSNHTKYNLSLREEKFYHILQHRYKTQYSSKISDENLLAYISPLPPQHSGISFYSSELIEELKDYFKIELIVLNKEEIDQKRFSDFTIRTVEYFVQNSTKYSKVLYHFGNSSFHSHMFALLKLIPGVVVLHDFYLSHLMYDVSMQKEGLDTFSEILYRSHGYKVLQKLSQKGSIEEVIWQYPANLEILQNAIGIIIHSDYSLELAKRYYFANNSKKWHKIPILKKTPVLKDKDITRQKLSIAKDTFVICSFGYIGPTKLTLELLDSFKNLPLKEKDYLLVLTGKISDIEYGLKLKNFIKENALQERVRITGWISDEEYTDYLNAADIAVQLRINSRGETSATVLDCMNYSLPLILNAHGSMKYIPKDTVLMIDEKFEAIQLTQAIELLYQDKQKRDTLAQNAKNLILQKHTPDICASLYAKALDESYKNTATLSPTIQNEPDLIYTAKELSRAESQSDQIRQRQILIDISSIVREDLKTGIQRVVRSLLKNLIDIVPDTYRVEAVYLTTIDEEFVYCYAHTYMSKFLGLKHFKLQDRPIDLYKDDIFYGLDLAGSMVSLATKAGIFKRYKAQGVKMVFAVYDLLPITHPEFFPPESKNIHEKWLNDIIDSSDKLICISKSVADEVKNWIKQHKQERQNLPKVTFVHLGAEFNTSKIEQNLSSKDQQRLDMLRNDAVTFLMVGTIEPRKGHKQVLEAFELLWQEGLDINLVIVGKKGWMVEDLIRKIVNHTQLNRHLFWLEFVSDSLLQKVYQTSDALISASESEGFGLPLIEAAYYGLPIIARDIPVFKEVAKKNAFYFPDDLKASTIASSIKDWLSLYKNNRHPTSKSLKYITWKESALLTFEELL